MSSQPIVVEQLFSVQPNVVWQAVTKPELMRRWYFAPIEDFRAEVGFETEFDIETGGRVFRHEWRVTGVVPGESITYEWRYRGFPGLGSTEWKLFGTRDGTRLRLLCSGIESFPQDIPEFSVESCTAGWQYFIQQRLTDFLNQF